MFKFINSIFVITLTLSALSMTLAPSAFADRKGENKYFTDEK